jgi:hypothetical protein
VILIEAGAVDVDEHLAIIVTADEAMSSFVTSKDFVLGGMV